MHIRIREKPDRETWLTWRLENSNASEAGAHLRCHDYCSQMQMFHEKRSGLTQASTRIMERGLDLEAAVIAMVARERPEWRVEACNDYYDAPDLRIGCSPDAFAWSGEWEGRANLQIKVIARRVFEEKWRNDDGNAGLEFVQVSTVVKEQLKSWLGGRLEESLHAEAVLEGSG